MEWKAVRREVTGWAESQGPEGSRKVKKSAATMMQGSRNDLR